MAFGFFFSRFFSFLFRDNIPVTRVRQALHRSNAQAGLQVSGGKHRFGLVGCLCGNFMFLSP